MQGFCLSLRVAFFVVGYVLQMCGLFVTVGVEKNGMESAASFQNHFGTDLRYTNEFVGAAAA